MVTGYGRVSAWPTVRHVMRIPSGMLVDGSRVTVGSPGPGGTPNLRAPSASGACSAPAASGPDTRPLRFCVITLRLRQGISERRLRHVAIVSHSLGGRGRCNSALTASSPMNCSMIR